MTDIEEYNKRHPVRRNPDTGEVVGEKRMGLREKLKGRVQGFEAGRRAKAEAQKIEQAEADKAYEAGRKKGLAKGAYKRGYEEGKRHGSKGQSKLGVLGDIGGFVAAHPMDIGETSKRMNSDYFGFSAGGPSTKDFGFGPSPGKKKKSSRLEDDFGF